MASSRKFRNVVDNGRAAFVVDDIASLQPWRVRCLEIRGRATAKDPPSREGARDGGLIRVHPEKIISFGIEEASQETSPPPEPGAAAAPNGNAYRDELPLGGPGLHERRTTEQEKCLDAGRYRPRSGRFTRCGEKL